MTLNYNSDSEAQTDRLGRCIAACLLPGTTIGLIGTLGSGKTFLTRSIAGALGVDPAAVVSPTFTLCQVYQGRLTLVHLDAYRLKDADEFWELGVMEFFSSPVVTLIEWADKFPQCLPDSYLEICIEVAEPARQIRLAACGSGTAEAVLDCLRLELGG